MSSIACGVTSSLLTRAADVTLKERRPLVLMVRESPLHLGHLRSMTSLAEDGCDPRAADPDSITTGFHPRSGRRECGSGSRPDRSAAENASRWNGPARPGRASESVNHETAGGFSGGTRAFSQVAARQLAGDNCIPVPMQAFEDLFVSVVNGKCHAAVIPIENTLHGSIHENYDHLLKYNLPIRGEPSSAIVHNLMVAMMMPPGIKFSQLRRVFRTPWR